jgi:hypothetical protein
VIYELAEIIDQTQKRTYIMHVFGNWPGLDGLNFLGVRANPLLIHNVAQVFNLLLGKTGLCFTHVKLFMPKHFQHKAHMRFMFSLSSGENENVINVYNNKLSNVRVKDRIYHRLKSGWGIS